MQPLFVVCVHLRVWGARAWTGVSMSGESERGRGCGRELPMGVDLKARMHHQALLPPRAILSSTFETVPSAASSLSSTCAATVPPATPSR